jgi:acetyltransferase-like isoleucine patch superfamily enzyme
MEPEYYSVREIEQMGFRSVGRQVLISRTARIYHPEKMTVGGHVLIDDFTILNGEIHIGNHVHISSHTELYAGTASITLEDFVGLSSHISVYATSDDYSGASLNGLTVPSAFRFEKNLPVVIKKHALLGTHCVVLPGVTVGEGCSFGSASLINKDAEPWGMYAGIPARFIREREKGLLEFERRLNGEK